MTKPEYFIGVLLLLVGAVIISGCIQTTSKQTSSTNITAKLVNVTHAEFVQSAGYYEGELVLVDVKTGKNYSVPACSKSWGWVKLGACYEFDPNEVNQSIGERKYSAELSGCYVGTLKQVACP